MTLFYIQDLYKSTGSDMYDPFYIQDLYKSTGSDMYDPFLYSRLI